METTTQTTQPSFDHWAIVELMGHVRLAGKVTEEKRFGVEMGRIDIPQEDGTTVTQYFGGSSVYRITPTSEDIARRLSRHAPAPVQAWELRDREPALPSPSRDYDRDDEDSDYTDGDFDDRDPYANE